MPFRISSLNTLIMVRGVAFAQPISISLFSLILSLYCDNFPSLEQLAAHSPIFFSSLSLSLSRSYFFSPLLSTVFNSLVLSVCSWLFFLLLSFFFLLLCSVISPSNLEKRKKRDQMRTFKHVLKLIWKYKSDKHKKQTR